MCRKWRHRPLVSVRGGERSTFRDLWRRPRDASTSSKATAGCRHVLRSSTSWKNTRALVIRPGRRTRKDGRVTGPVRQAASWKRWHGAAKRSGFPAVSGASPPGKVSPKHRGRFLRVPVVWTDAFVTNSLRVFEYFPAGLARFYAALRRHATRGLSPAWKVRLCPAASGRFVAADRGVFTAPRSRRVKGDRRG